MLLCVVVVGRWYPAKSTAAATVATDPSVTGMHRSKIECCSASNGELLIDLRCWIVHGDQIHGVERNLMIDSTGSDLADVQSAACGLQPALFLRYRRRLHQQKDRWEHQRRSAAGLVLLEAWRTMHDSLNEQGSSTVL